MRVAGVAVGLPSPRRPATRLVLVNDAGGGPTVEVAEDVTTNDVETPVQLHETAEVIRSRLKGREIDRVIVRRADHAPVQAATLGPRLRLLMEGAVTAAARSVVVDTRIATAKDIATWVKSNKADCDAEAVKLGLAPKFTEATSAALVGLDLQ